MNDEQKNDELQQKIAEAQAKAGQKEETAQQKDAKDTKIEELTEALARALADLQNFKRRNEGEKASFVKFANAEMLRELLPVIDNFDRSANHMPEDLKTNDWAKGVIHIHDNLMKILEKIGVKKIPTVGEKLNPNQHEAMLTGPGEKDIITEELEPGYTLHGDVIKAAKVKVGDGS